MIVWMVWIQGEDATWLETAWDDQMTANNPDGWKSHLDKVREVAFKSNYEMRIQQVTIPGVYEMFEIPKATAKHDSA